MIIGLALTLARVLDRLAFRLDMWALNLRDYIAKKQSDLEMGGDE